MGVSSRPSNGSADGNGPRTRGLAGFSSRGFGGVRGTEDAGAVRDSSAGVFVVTTAVVFGPAFSDSSVFAIGGGVCPVSTT